MRRRGGLLGGAAVAVAALLGAVPALLGGGIAAAESGECEWRPHKVRVVKHVKRHGKRVTVVRKRVRWSCVAVPAPAPSAPTASPAPTPTPAPTLPAPPTFSPEDLSNPQFLGAQAYEFGFTPTKPSFELQAGADTVELINRGEDAHDLHLESLSTHATVLELSATASGGHSRGTAVLEPGEYRLYCSLADHAEKGMERTLVVSP
jgi:plastocyanin